jgi:glyoxylate reductase
MRKRIFVARKIPGCGIDLLRARFEVDVWEGSLPPPREALLERVKNIDGILSLLSDTIDGPIFDAAGRSLKAVANFAVGYNNIDVAAAKMRGIQVGNTPDVLTDATADIAVGLILASARRFQESIDQVRRFDWKTWEPLGLIGRDLRERTLGIVGMGRIGRAVAQRLHGGWKMRVLYTARTPKLDIDRELSAQHVSLETLLQESDFISLHTDLNPNTKHLINESSLGLMKESAVLVNTARGGIVDQSALYQALKNGRIFAAGLDVTDPEPLPDTSPLRSLSSCLILPHIGSATETARNQMANMAAENLIAALDGQPMPYSVG